ncbi:lipase family protein [Anianabacter salinae]|uniref:hypothetical protein n=1 Tax=Anianabacter salinae TaxID=2851023 RepID=UPI00225E080E|nr:hypothetical protein [Anianabacter salinae]MBV0913987.1 hypothetical protein [Anianabacter salinae]
MPLLRVNAQSDRPALHGDGNLDGTLAAALAALPPGAPVVVMIHGFKFSPFRHETSPHRHILSMAPRRACWKALSWPRHLGFGRGDGHEGLAIALGWDGSGDIWQAWHRAGIAGAALARLLRMIACHRAGPVDIMAHSLGARVALTALSASGAGAVGRVVLLSAAAFTHEAQAALDTPAGRSAEVVNVTSRENDVFDALFEGFVGGFRLGRTIGSGLRNAPRNWVDLQIDKDRTREGLAALGFRIPAPKTRVCHWSSYLRPGLFPLYRALIRDRAALPLGLLRQIAPAQDPRWSRLIPVRLPRLRGPWGGAGLARS